MVRYELWLDESGDFVKDLRGEEVPSIVGGLLLHAGLMQKEDAKKLLEEVKSEFPFLSQWVHSTDITGQNFGRFATKVLTKLADKEIQFVVFENQERVKIVNSDMTYLHILSEGIIQLFQTLAMENENIELHIIAARRNRTAEDVDTKYIERIKAQEYTQRLQEKLDLGYARRSLRSKNWKWMFTLESARTDHRLMLADVVCHSWFRRDSNKFSEEQREQLSHLFNPNLHFTAIERATLAAIKRQLAEGALGEALYEWLLAEEELFASQAYNEEIAASVTVDRKITILSVILKRLQQLPDFAQKTELTVVTNHLKTLIQLQRDFVKAKRVLLKIQNQIIPLMQEQGMKNYTFFFDVYLMLFTNATHQGDIELSEMQMQEGHKYLSYLTGRWESLDLVLDFFVREAVHLMNTYNFTRVIERMDQLEKFIESTIELFPMALQDELSIESQKMNADILGKVMGTRLQARCFLGRKYPEQIELARQDSERAISEFTEESDLSRQYQYRSQIECEAGNFQVALDWLGKSVGLQDEHLQPFTVIQSILETSTAIRVFGVMHYSRLMTEAALQDQLHFAEELYKAWTITRVEERVLQDIRKQHPYEVILWKLGTYLMVTGSTKAAMKRYKDAIDICLHQPNHLTLHSIALAISAEQVYFLSKAGKKYREEQKMATRLLVDMYKKLNRNNLPVSMREYFQGWQEELQNFSNVNNHSTAVLLLSRQVAY